jgi:ferric-dicitrate binding protein FerR (iron transport regulator)
LSFQAQQSRAKICHTVELANNELTSFIFKLPRNQLTAAAAAAAAACCAWQATQRQPTYALPQGANGKKTHTADCHTFSLADGGRQLEPVVAVEAVEGGLAAILCLI